MLTNQSTGTVHSLGFNFAWENIGQDQQETNITARRECQFSNDMPNVNKPNVCICTKTKLQFMYAISGVMTHAKRGRL